MRPKPITDWDDAYANMAHVPGADRLPAQWAKEAEDYRSSGITVETHTYGAGAREAFDLVLPDGPPRGLAVFVHGGYWMKFHRTDWTHFAEGARANGWAVCIPSYTLAPDAPIATMTAQIGAAITAAAGLVPGPIRLAGHSAGGHLVTRMICDDTPLSADVLTRIAHVLAISGVHDLRPLLNVALNDTLQLDLAAAIAESPCLKQPLDTTLTAWVGGGERPVFIGQSRLIAEIWRGLGADVTCHIDGTMDHFNIIDGLRDKASPITRAWVGA